MKTSGIIGYHTLKTTLDLAAFIDDGIPDLWTVASILPDKHCVDPEAPRM